MTANATGLILLLAVWGSFGEGRGTRPRKTTLVAPVGEAAMRAKRLLIKLAPGEVPDQEKLVVKLDGGHLAFKVAGTYADGSAAGLVVELPTAGGSRRKRRGPSADGATIRPRGVSYLTCGPVTLSAPVNLYRQRVALRSAPAAAKLAGAFRLWPSIGASISVLGKRSTGQGSHPSWWNSVKPGFSSEVAEDDFGAKIEYVRAALAEQGRVKEAIRCYDRIVQDAEVAAPRAALRAGYEIAYLYEVFLKDSPRALDWYVRLGRVDLKDPEQRIENQIAADAGCLRSLSVFGGRGEVTTLYEQFARTLLLAGDRYGDLLLPEVFLRLGSLYRASGRLDEAKASYQACLKTGGSLPPSAQSSFRAPADSARRALAGLAGRSLTFASLPDGMYRGEARGFNDVISVWFTVRGRRAVALQVHRFGDKRPLDAYELMPRKILSSQGLDVDAVTGATITSNAIVNATADAILRKARVSDDAGP